MSKRSKVMTEEELLGLLDKDLAWRKKEMVEYRFLVVRLKENEGVLVRAGIALLCAHFEGFIKKASNVYVQFVDSQDIPFNKLKNGFLAVKLMNDVKQCSHAGKYGPYVDLLDKIIGHYAEESFEFNKSLDKKLFGITTKSNPKYENLIDILKAIGIQSDIFDLKRRYIDNMLLDYRNQIVHGRKAFYKQDDFNELFDFVFKALDEYKNLILEAAKNSCYLKGNLNNVS